MDDFARERNPGATYEATVPPRPARPIFLPDNIPASLKAHRQWVVWRYQWRQEKGKWDKPPYDPVRGCAASSTDRATWASFDEALASYHAGDWDGVGLALAGPAEGPGGEQVGGPPQLVAFDLDKCRDPQTGQVEPWAAEVVAALGTYAEVSPSGRGVRLFAAGRKPGLKCRKGPFEVYEHGRYMTVTGARLQGVPETVEARQAAIEQVYEKFLGAQGPQACPASRSPGDRSGGHPLTPDDELVGRARRAANGDKFARLWEGDWQDLYTSQSEADLALCALLAYWTGGDGERIDRLFRGSGLMRDKWDRPTGDQTYGERTLTKALEGGEFAAGNSGPREAECEHLTDVGNARRLVRLHGMGLRYCHPWGRWLAWDGRRWRRDDTGGVTRLAKETLVDLFRRASAGAAAAAKELEDHPNGDAVA